MPESHQGFRDVLEVFNHPRHCQLIISKLQFIVSKLVLVIQVHFSFGLLSVQFSHSVVSDSLWPHESQHTRPPCPSPSHGVHSHLRPWSRWCHPAISSSVIPFSACPQSSRMYYLTSKMQFCEQRSRFCVFTVYLTTLNLLSDLASMWTHQNYLEGTYSVGKESARSEGDSGSIPGLGRSPGEGNCKPFQYPCLENPMDRGAWQATVHGVARVRHNLVTKPPPQFSGMFKDGVWRPSTFCYTFYAVPESVATSHDEINLCWESVWGTDWLLLFLTGFMI